MEENSRNILKKVLSDRAYDILSALSLYWLPAIGAGYLTIGQIWDLNFTNEVAQTIIVLSTILGVILGVSKHNYTPPQSVGSFIPTATDSGGVRYDIHLNKGLEEFLSGGTVLLDVKPLNDESDMRDFLEANGEH